MSYTTQQILAKVDVLVDAFAVATGTTVTPKELTAANDTVEAGYYEATTLSTVDPDLNSDNIKTGVTIFGVVGAADVQDIADADLTIAEAPTGKKFYAVSGGVKTGTGTKTLSAANDTVDAGYYAATTLSAVDADLAAGNIKAGETIFGVLGTYETPILGSAVAADVLALKTFFNDDATAGVVGTMPTVALDPALNEYPAGYHVGAVFGVEGAATVQDISASDAAVGDVLATKTFFSATGAIKTGIVAVGADVVGADGALEVLITAGLYAGTEHVTASDTLLVAGNIKDGVSIFGVEGTYDESATPITAGTVATGLEGFVNGAKVTGSGTKTLSAADDHVHAGYYEETTLAAVDTDLATANVKAGVTIFGIAGKTEVVDTTGADGAEKATGTITSTGVNVTADDTVLVDTKTYTFKDALTPTEGEVLKGASAEASLANLKAAINHGGTPDTDYSCAAAHPTVEGTGLTSTELTLLALSAGVAGNAIDLVVTAVTLSASAAHLAGGLSPATAAQISAGYFAWVDGVKVEGSL
jgi:hypothetical protein